MKHLLKMVDHAILDWSHATPSLHASTLSVRRGLPHFRSVTSTLSIKRQERRASIIGRGNPISVPLPLRIKKTSPSDQKVTRSSEGGSVGDTKPAPLWEGSPELRYVLQSH